MPTPFLSTASNGIALVSANLRKATPFLRPSSPTNTPPNATDAVMGYRTTYFKLRSGISWSPILSLNPSHLTLHVAIGHLHLALLVTQLHTPDIILELVLSQIVQGVIVASSVQLIL